MEKRAELADLKVFIKDEWQHLSGEQRNRIVAHMNALECELMEQFDPAGFSLFEPFNSSTLPQTEAQTPSEPKPDAAPS